MGRTYKQLSLDDRCEIARLSANGSSVGQIAAALDRPPSTISRELKRNRGRQVGYKPTYAQQQTRARRWKGSRLERDASLRREVLAGLSRGWSPEQVAGRLARERGRKVISYESIYRFIYAQITRTTDFSWRRYLPARSSPRSCTRGSAARRRHRGASGRKHRTHGKRLCIRPGDAMIGYLWIGLGGALGSIGRAWLALTVARITGPQFPWGTILINITGSFVIGFFGTLTASGSRFVVPVDARAFVMVGICGGFTTFSSFSLQMLELARDGRMPQALGNIGLSVMLCLSAVAAGYYGAATVNRQF